MFFEKGCYEKFGLENFFTLAASRSFKRRNRNTLKFLYLNNSNVRSYLVVVFWKSDVYLLLILYTMES